MFDFKTVVCTNLTCGWSMTTHKDKQYEECPICKFDIIESTGEVFTEGSGDEIGRDEHE